MKRVGSVLACGVLLVPGCGGTGDGSNGGQEATEQGSESNEPSRPDDPKVLAQRLKAEVRSAGKIIVYTENNDPNDLLGRPNGYSKAALVVDDGSEVCDLKDPGIDCGAVIEIWSSDAEVKRRSKYIQTLQKEAPMLGTEYHYPAGHQLLRVAGVVKPSIAKQYESAWKEIG